MSAATAERLDRLLHILPRAAAEGGAAVSELAAELEVAPRQVLRDVEELAARAYYHLAGGADDIQIAIDGGRITVRTEEFRRPTRLSPREAAALGLALRVRAREATPEDAGRLRALAARLESELAALPDDALAAAVAVDPGVGADDGTRLALEDACRERRVVRIRYVKPGQEAEERVVHPYTLATAEGAWYLLGHSEEAGETRNFRLDRMVEVEPDGAPEAFQVPEDFDPGAWLDGGRVYLPGETVEEVEVAVRYSPAVARWILEREPGEAEAGPDGAVVVTHRVADRAWLVRHVLQYGADAEVVGPPEMREAVGEAVGRVG